MFIYVVMRKDSTNLDNKALKLGTRSVGIKAWDYSVGRNGDGDLRELGTKRLAL